MVSQDSKHEQACRIVEVAKVVEPAAVVWASVAGPTEKA